MAWLVMDPRVAQELVLILPRAQLPDGKLGELVDLVNGHDDRGRSQAWIVAGQDRR